ncbi:DNA-binding response regulator, OmpR family, contains REC and winged-helix (wHTH) domain [Lachnospiraceae bacterium C10]|nr:DNA-binding response regulator, OmpR family, contains REC and winged-helix (wHTH) domain [Lachnospiraceae bacterium C10]
MNRILVADDEADIRNALRIYLQAEGYEVEEASNGQEVLKILKESQDTESTAFQLVLLDIMMPVMDGIICLHNIRESYNLPVILLTAKSENSDKVLGLTVGADDYVTKPFDPVELIARVKSQLRRYLLLGNAASAPETEKASHLTIGGIELFDDEKKVTLDGAIVSLTPTEYDILKLLMRNPGKVFAPAEIYRNVWEDPIPGAEGTVAVHIRHLREKLEFNPADPRYLMVVWGQGYKITPGNREDRDTL